MEDVSLADDQIRVMVEGGRDMASMLSSHRGRSLSVTYCVGVKDAPTVHTPTATYSDADGRVVFKDVQTFYFRRRGAVENMFKRKKATFEIVLHRGFFQSNVTIASARLPLAGLLHTGTIGGDLSLTDVDGRKCVGGTLRVKVSLRKPICGAEVITETTRELQIGPWPDAIAPHVPVAPAAPADPVPAQAESVRLPDSAMDTGSVSVAPATAAENPTSSSASGQSSSESGGAFSALSEAEKEDPFNVNLLMSNDVLEAEIESCQAELKTAKSEDDRQEINLRLMLLTGRLSVLVSQVQSGKITLPQYVEALNARIAQDKVLAVYCSKNDRKPEALRLMKRIKIMETEVAGAANALEDDGSDSDGG